MKITPLQTPPPYEKPRIEMLQMTGAPRAVAAGLREARVSSGDTADSRQRTAAWAEGLLAGAGSMRLCWWSVVLLLAAAGAAGKASSRHLRGAEVSPSNSEPRGNIFFKQKGKI